MFAKPMNVPNARVGAARTGQNYSGQPDPQGVSCDASLGACPPRGAITVLGFDITSINTQYTNITLPTGQTYAALTGWVQTQAVGTMGEFYLTARPKCKVIALALYFTPAVGNQVDIVAIGAGDKDSEGSHKPRLGGHKPTLGGHKPTLGGESEDASVQRFYQYGYTEGVANRAEGRSYGSRPGFMEKLGFTGPFYADKETPLRRRQYEAVLQGLRDAWFAGAV